MNLKDVAEWSLKLIAHVDKVAIKHDLCDKEQLRRATNNSAAIAGLIEICGLEAVEQSYGFKITPSFESCEMWRSMSESDKIQYLCMGQILGYRVLRACEMPELGFQDHSTLKDIVDCWAALDATATAGVNNHEEAFVEALGNFRLSDLIQFARDSSEVDNPTYSAAFFKKLLTGIESVSCGLLKVHSIKSENVPAGAIVGVASVKVEPQVKLDSRAKIESQVKLEPYMFAPGNKLIN